MSWGPECCTGSKRVGYKSCWTLFNACIISNQTHTRTHTHTHSHAYTQRPLMLMAIWSVSLACTGRRLRARGELTFGPEPDSETHSPNFALINWVPTTADKVGWNFASIQPRPCLLSSCSPSLSVTLSRPVDFGMCVLMWFHACYQHQQRPRKVTIYEHILAR